MPPIIRDLGFMLPPFGRAVNMLQSNFEMAPMPCLLDVSSTINNLVKSIFLPEVPLFYNTIFNAELLAYVCLACVDIYWSMFLFSIYSPITYHLKCDPNFHDYIHMTTLFHLNWQERKEQASHVAIWS
ncbi:hypothetical protein ACJX0J_007692, partial [Zea mays]